ncbi:esterase-like activity of phytase family protein [Ramlibacter sp. USB13]|uniref:Esterase-like activity of phytase family protein n=1 Tax=Ramlibacter cellulosilyticus TaxID=2764187 RepID=A0A923MPM6_9BURK|nr:esterase-like activity of phytase family protein [Ramlibacter cellulosilyticus]MBC5782895.1 esterase-like activity of phytase family protein [Ramlibacter cellulosilyticus]
MVFPHASPGRRVFLRGAASALALAAVGCATRAPSTPSAAGASQLRLLGETTLPHGLAFEGTTVGGLSAIDHDPATGTWVALSDDRSELQPARFYTLRVDVRDGGLAVEVADVVTLRQADGKPFPRRDTRGEVVDPEGMRLLPGARGVLWTSEGDFRADQPPTVRESRLDGTYVRNFAVPPMFRFAQRPGSGSRNNLTFEGVALTPDARTAWVSMENALQQDGPEPGVGRPGGPCRFTAYDVASGRAVRQVAYLPDAVPRAPTIPGAPVDNGVAEILMVDAQRMLVLERAFVFGFGTSLRLYEIDTSAASDTLAQERLREGDYRPAAKRLVADFATLGLSRLDNTEGMCWGPRLRNGHRSLVVVSDDNFSSRQVTQFAAFDYLEPT